MPVSHKPAQSDSERGSSNTGHVTSASPKDTPKKDIVRETRAEGLLCSIHPQPITPYDVSYINYGIYVGSVDSVCARFLEANGITHVLSVGKKAKEELPEKKFKTKYIEAEDDESANLRGIFDASFSFIDEGTKGTNKILVHCWAGYSRSITVVTGYLHHRKKFSWKQAQLWVANKRPQFWPHPAFLEYMAEQSSKESGGRTTFTVDDFTLPGQNIRDYCDRINANRKHLKSFDLKTFFSGCEEDKRNTEPLVFWTEEGKETYVES